MKLKVGLRPWHDLVTPIFRPCLRPPHHDLLYEHSLSKWKPIFTNRYRHSGGFRVNLLFGFGIEKNSNPTLALYNWFVKFYQMLNSKATFYFYEVRPTPSDVKNSSES